MLCYTQPSSMSNMMHLTPVITVVSSRKDGNENVPT